MLNCLNRLMENSGQKINVKVVVECPDAGGVTDETAWKCSAEPNLAK